jgi:hypothetical protein
MKHNRVGGQEELTIGSTVSLAMKNRSTCTELPYWPQNITSKVVLRVVHGYFELIW